MDRNKESPNFQDFEKTKPHFPEAYKEGAYQETLPSPSALGLENYDIIELVGEGGMGIVYKARQKSLKRIVALKVLKEKVKRSEYEVKMFKREAKALANLKHPAIVPIFDSGVTQEGVYYFAMEYAEGLPLDEYCKEKQLSIQDKLRLFVKICDGVNYAHQRSIIHRDLKPSNIIINGEGNPKILDFGLAKIIRKDENVSSVITLPGMIIGTLQYMSPEQTLGDPSAIDGRTDVYSLGVMLYEVLTGQSPYTLDSVIIKSLQTIRDVPPKKPSTIIKALKGEVEIITLKCLEKEKERRYRGAGALKDDLVRYLNHKPIRARPPSAIYHTKKLVQKNRIASAVIAIAFILLIAGIYLYISGISNARRLAEKAATYTALLQTIGLRVQRGGTELPAQLKLVVANPFDEKLSGTLVWEVPDESPWRIPEKKVSISVNPGARQTLTIHVPSGGTADDTTAIEPFPAAVWNLSLGGKALWADVRAEVKVDRWPYSEVMTELKKAVSTDNVERIVAGSQVSTTLQIPRSNPTRWRMHEVMKWNFPEGCRWEVSPALAVIDLAPGEQLTTKFQVRFASLPGEIFPLPRMESAIELDGEEVLKTSTRLPISAREYFSKQMVVARCIRVDEAPKIDGKLIESVWQECPVLSSFLLPRANGLTEYPTEARLAYDSENLYVSFRCFEPDLSGLIVKSKNHDDPLWNDDSVEIFLDTDMNRRTYFHYVFNAKGVIYDGMGWSKEWEGPCRVKTGRQGDAWTVEAAIPWNTIRMKPPEAGTKIGLELARNRMQKPRELTQWSPTFEADNHVPSRFGVLVFEQPDESPSE